MPLSRDLAFACTNIVFVRGVSSTVILSEHLTKKKTKKKHEFHFFASSKNIKKHKFHFFARLKNLKKHEFHFASLKNLKKHEFHLLQD